MGQPLAQADVLRILREIHPHLRQRYGVEQIAVYGSFAREQQTGASDVDILVRLARPLGWAFVDLACELEEALGRKVDLTTFDTLARSLETAHYRRLAREIQGTLVYA